MNNPPMLSEEFLFKQCYKKTCKAVERKYPAADADLATMEAIGIAATRSSRGKVIPFPCAYVRKIAFGIAHKQVDRHKTVVWEEQQAASIEGRTPSPVEEVLNPVKVKRARQGCTMYDVFRDLVKECEGPSQEQPDLVGLRRKEAYERRLMGEKPGSIAIAMARQYGESGKSEDISDKVAKDADWMKTRLRFLMDRHDVRGTIFQTARGGEKESPPAQDRKSNPQLSDKAIASIVSIVEKLPSARSWAEIGGFVVLQTTAYCPSAERLELFEAWEGGAVLHFGVTSGDEIDSGMVPLDFLDIHYHARARNCPHCASERGDQKESCAAI